VIYTLVENCRRHGIPVEEYLCDRPSGHTHACINPLSRKTCPNLTPVLSLLTPEEITHFTTPNPFIHIDSACSHSRYETPKS
jgi:hypothetical protein